MAGFSAFVAVTVGLREANGSLRARNERWACRSMRALADEVLARGAKRDVSLARWARSRGGWAALLRVERGPLARVWLAGHTDRRFRIGALVAAGQPRDVAGEAKRLYDRTVAAYAQGQVTWWQSEPGSRERVGCALRKGAWVLAGQGLPAQVRVRWKWAVLIAAILGPGLLLFVVLPWAGRWGWLVSASAFCPETSQKR